MNKVKRTVHPGEWWLLPNGESLIGKVSVVGYKRVKFEHGATFDIEQVLKGKRYKIEEIK